MFEKIPSAIVPLIALIITFVLLYNPDILKLIKKGLLNNGKYLAIDLVILEISTVIWVCLYIYGEFNESVFCIGILPFLLSQSLKRDIRI